MNSSTYKLKRKRSKKVPQLTQSNVMDQEKLAAQSLCFISNFEDEIHHTKQLNPQSHIFNSVHFHPPQHQNHLNPTNKDCPNQHINKSAQVSQLEKYLDNKFIQQSRLLLKLYQTQPNQKLFVNHQCNQQSLNKTNKNYQTEQPAGILTNSFKSDCVFVVKRMPLKQTAMEKKIIIKTQKHCPQKISPYKTYKTQNLNNQKGNKILRISPLLQNHTNNKSQQNWMTKSLQFHSSNCITQQKKKYSLAQYAKIQNYKSLNNTLTFKCQSFKQQRSYKKIRHPNKYVRTQLNNCDQENGKDERNSNSFRKRFTFYQSQKSKTYQKYQRLLK